MGAIAQAPKRSGVVVDPGMCGRSLRGNREISRLANSVVLRAALARIGKARKLKPVMHDCEKSDFAVVATKPTNKVERSAAEPVERRAEAKRNVSEQSTHRTQSRITRVTGA